MSSDSHEASRAAAAAPAVLYVGARLPSLSETFVYNEILAIRRLGIRVVPASVHPPEPGLGDARLTALAAESVPIYGSGPWALLRDAARECLARPRRFFGTIGLALRDGAFSRDIRLGRRPKVVWQALAGAALAQRVRELRVAHVHAHMANVPTTIAMYAACQMGVPFSFTGHANDLFPQRTLLREKLRRARFVACISHWHRDLYRGIVPRPDEAMPIVRCGVEIPDLSSARSEAKDATLVMAVGRLVPKKGFDVLVRSLARLLADGRPIRCLIVGEGPQRAELEALARQLRVESHVAFLGARRNEEVKRLLAGADMFVLPCRIDSQGDRDGIPVVLMEAMATGVPVVAGDLPTLRDLITHRETGLLVPAGDAAAVASAMSDLIDNTALRAKLRSGGRERVSREFSLEGNAQRLASALSPSLAPESDRRWPGSQTSAANGDCF